MMTTRPGGMPTSVTSLLRFLAGIIFFMPGLVGAQVAWKEIKDGQEYLRSGEYLKTLSLMNDAIGRFPVSPELYFLRGYAKYSLDDYLGAEQDYTKSIELSPAIPEVYINRAEVRSRQSNLYGALEDLSRARDLDSTNLDIYQSQARIKLFFKKYYACISDCNNAIRKKTGNEAFYLLRGCAELGLERTGDAMISFREALKLNPSNAYTHIQMGSVFLEQEDIDSALRYFENAVRIDSNNVYAHFNRSLARIKSKDLKGALEDLNVVIRLSPYNSYAYFNRALISNEQKDLTAAIQDLNIVIRLNPRNITSYYYRGLLKAEQKDYYAALEDLDKTIELYPGYADAYFERSKIKLALKNHAGAVEDLRRAEEYGRRKITGPDSLTSEKKDYMKSLVTLTGDFEEMNTSTSKFQNQEIDIQLMPMFTLFSGKADYNMVYLYDSYRKPHYYTTIIALTNHVQILVDSVFSREAAIQTRQIDSVSPHPEAYLKRGVALTVLNQFEQAIRDFDSSLHLDSTFVLTYFSRANARYKLIRQIQSENDYRHQITIGQKFTPRLDLYAVTGLEHTFEKVIEDYGKSLSYDSGFYFAYYNRGVVYAGMGDYPRAIDDFTRVIALKRSFPEAYYNRGLLLLILNQRKAACEDLSRAGELGIADAYKVMKRFCFKEL